MTRELKRKLDELAIECEDTYSMANRTEDMLEEIFDDHEAIVKAKDEEIESLKAERDHFHNKYIQVGEYIGEWIKGAKARSIVAMLFWEWRKSIRESGDNTFYNDEFDDGNYWFVNAKEQSFKQAYKMLKDTK